MRKLDEIALPDNERHAIQAAAAALQARFPIADLVLFGSKARGDSDPDSDIDLLVLTERRLDRREEQALDHALFDIAHRFDVAFGPLTIEMRDWRHGVHSILPIHTEVEREGVRCLDRVAMPGEPASDGPPAAAREELVQQVVDEWMSRADEAMASARAELAAHRYSFVLNRAYYAAFYAASAVLLSRGRHFVKHRGVQTALHRDLVHPGLLASEHGAAYDALFTQRLVADYTVAGVDAEQASRALEQAEALVAALRRLCQS
jgi:uncharacterized protein (UPF0332 family)/predicted nucleotidyltransferase